MIFDRRDSHFTQPGRGIHRLGLLFAVLLSAGVLSGCSLLKFNLGGDPMPSRDLSLRLQAREFAGVFSARVAKVADEIAVRTSSTEVQANTIRWKLAATAQVRQTAFGADPMVALVDTWTFCRQMSDYFAKYSGDQALGTNGYLATSLAQEMEREIETVARRILPSSDFDRAFEFVSGYTATNALSGIGFERDSAALPWRRGAAADVPPTMGNMPEAISDLSDRVSVMSQQIPLEVRWRVDLERAEWEPFTQELKKFSAGADAMFQTFPVLAENTKVLVENARQMTKAAGELSGTLAPELAKFEQQWKSTLLTLTNEREAVMQAVRSERVEIIKSLETQREALTRDFARERAEIAVAADRMAQNAIDHAGQQLRGIIGTVFFYVTLILLIVLGLPFVFGYWVGKTATRRTQSSAVPDRQ